MIWIGKTLFACLLLALTFRGHAEAARPIEQRGRSNPYLASPPGLQPDTPLSQPRRDLGEKKFALRHIYHHGAQRHPRLHRYIDIPRTAELMVTDDDGATKQLAPQKLVARALSTNIERMADRRRSTIDGLLDHAATHGVAKSLFSSDWTVDEVPGPNSTDKSTVLTFAKMAANAYVTEPWTGEWHDVRGGFNYTDDFGWEQDGLRGHIFADEKNETVVIGLKGTSMAIFDGAETTGNDKINDNLFGSCCCAQGGQYLWKQVCDCMTDTYTCNNTCLVQAIREKSHYYWAAKDLYHNVTKRYPTSDVWMSGHSLGGVVSTLLGMTFGLPVMTFEAFPDALAASRLGLPTPPGYHIGSHQTRRDVAIHHYGHTADPVFMGSCNGVSSLCSIGGYAFEGLCHTGKTCIYDTVNDLGWRVGVGTHSIQSVIKDVLEQYDDVPPCEEDIECYDCVNWKFFESNGSTTTTSASSSSTYSRTRSATCQTPGWWGCLDESTTSGATTTTTTETSSSSSTSCETPGWFGCKDPTTTTTTTSHEATVTTTVAPPPSVTSTSPPHTSTTSCRTPGWFGCNDPTTTTTTTPMPSSAAVHPTPLATSTHNSCTHTAWLGLVCMDPSPASSSAPSPTNLPTTRRKFCVSRQWYGACKEWSGETSGFKGDL